MSDKDISLIAHLMQRAGFGATRKEQGVLAAKGYEVVVEELLHPEEAPEFEEDLLYRYYTSFPTHEPIEGGAAEWIYRMLNSPRPLEEKMTLFWHHVFATGYSKSEHAISCLRQIRTFRRNGLADMRTPTVGCLLLTSDVIGYRYTRKRRAHLRLSSLRLNSGRRR